MKKIHIRRTIIIVIILTFIALLLASFSEHLKNPTISGINTNQKQTQNNPFQNISVEAQAVYIYDITTGKVIYQKDADNPRPLASLTKLAAIFTAAKSVPLQTTVTITPTDILSEGDTGLMPGEDWSLQDLIEFSLVTSSNDGITAIARTVGEILATTTVDDDNAATQVFVDKMNQTAKGLGLTHTIFSDPTGLDLSTTTAGAFGSAKDVATLISDIVKSYPDLIEDTGKSKSVFHSSQSTHIATNTDTELPNIPSVLASKTGYTDLAGGNLAVIFDVGFMHPVVAVVLGSSYDARFSDMETLVQATLQEFVQN
ncbi:MAG TPA: serine hydrolase [Candidatus Paceibacterota bacterium]|nr:serine hydrolase [Candidatus Paceibacterota bacterium]